MSSLDIKMVHTREGATEWIAKRDDELWDADNPIASEIEAKIYSEYCTERGLDADEIKGKLNCSDVYALVGYDYA